MRAPILGSPHSRLETLKTRQDGYGTTADDPTGTSYWLDFLNAELLYDGNRPFLQGNIPQPSWARLWAVAVSGSW